MSFENFQQNFANATGLIIDRTMDPPVVLGQAFVVSKSRAVTCASCVFNYTEAPWAAAVNFPHPDLILGIKSIALHPDFDKKEARSRYLAQTGLPSDIGSAQFNDLATLVLDATLKPLELEKVAEFHRALTLPFSSVGVEASGVVKDGDFLSLVKTILESGREGILTLFDQYNIPIARIKVDVGKVSKVYYKTLVNEMAFSEFVFRKPAKGFSFQPQGSIKWEELGDITVPTANLISESSRRAGELPSLLSRMGGGGARYQKAVQQFDPASTGESIRWLVERLWLALDGYITVDKLAERVGADTYSVIQGLRELANQGVVSLLNRATPFACGGQLGTPLISHTDFDINPGDPLMAFYLDPVSGAPNWRQGNFSGVASVLQPKNLLHTIQIPVRTLGALILKNYKLVGVHNGPMLSKPGQSLSGEKLYQMMWIGALLDMSTKRLREGEGQQQEHALSGLRSRIDTEQPVDTPVKQDKYICPSCYSTNTKTGPCFNCGTQVEAPLPEPEITGLAAKAPFKQLLALKKRYGVSNKQLAIALSTVVFVSFLGMMFHHEQSPAMHKPVADAGAIEHHSSEAAVQTAVEVAGFKGTAPPGYWYEDTSKITKPNESFGLYSEPCNQKVLFVIFDDMAAVSGLGNFTSRPLFTDAKRLLLSNKEADSSTETGSQIIGSGNLNWFLGHYETSNESNHPMLVGSFPAKAVGKSVLVIGQTLRDHSTYDHKSTLWLIDQMAEEFTKEGNTKRVGIASLPQLKAKENESGSEGKAEEVKITYATDEQIEEFLKDLEKKLQAKLSLPKEAADELKKKKSKKLKATVTVGIDNEGNVKKIELTEPSEWDKVNNALVKDINGCAPFVNVPKTKAGLLTFLVSLKKDQISLERP